jgi:hypothetical protein
MAGFPEGVDQRRQTSMVDQKPASQQTMAVGNGPHHGHESGCVWEFRDDEDDWIRQPID